MDFHWICMNITQWRLCPYEDSSIVLANVHFICVQHSHESYMAHVLVTSFWLADVNGRREISCCCLKVKSSVFCAAASPPPLSLSLARVLAVEQFAALLEAFYARMTAVFAALSTPHAHGFTRPHKETRFKKKKKETKIKKVINFWLWATSLRTRFHSYQCF